MIMSITVSVLYGMIEGPEAMKKLAEAGDTANVDPVLLLWLRVATLPLALLATLAFVQFFDKRPAASIGLTWPRGGGVQTLLGILVAALPLGFWLLLSDPWVSSTLLPWSEEALRDQPHLPLDGLGVGAMALAFLAVALIDELMFRGYIYSAFRERFEWVHAAGLTTLLFVATSAGHPDIGAAGLINIFLLGLSASAMREKTGSIWMSAVFAGSWNLLLGCGLSLPISGTLFPRLFDHQLEGPASLTGGSFGPEGSWLLTGPILILLIGLAWWTDKDAPPPSTEPEAEPTAEG